jgi:hypothetical protein
MVPVVPDDGVNKHPLCEDTKCKEKVPSMGARLGWYNLKIDVLLSTAANAIPPGSDELGKEAYLLQESDYSSKIDEAWCPHWRELVVDGVIADQKGNRYVNVVELAAARLNHNHYIVRGRIEKSSWRNQGDTWVNLLMLEARRTGNSFYPPEEDQWYAEPIDAEAATGYEVEVPTMTFDTWKEGVMKKLLEEVQAQAKANYEGAVARDAQNARTTTIHYCNKQAAEDAGVDMGSFRHETHAAVTILDGKFTPNPDGGGPKGGGCTFNERQASSAKKAFDNSAYKHERHRVEKNGKIVLNIQDHSGTLSKEIDDTTLACALVALGLIRSE